MKQALLWGLLLLATSEAAVAAQKCPAIETAMMDKGFGNGPWRVMSGGAAECSFMAANTRVNFGYNHMAAESAEAAQAAAVEMREAIAAKSAVEPMLSLGEQGFTYQPKNDAGAVDATSMFFYGHRGTLNVSAYLNLKESITPAQREFAANLVALTLGAATNAKALAKETTCPYVDDELVAKLLPGTVLTIAPDKNNCVLSADARVITVAIVRSVRSRELAEAVMRTGGCTVDPLPKLGKTAGIMHHCGEGNARTQVVVAADGRMLEIAYMPGQEPTDEQRATMADLTAFALKH